MSFEYWTPDGHSTITIAHLELLSCQPRVTVMSGFVYKVIRDLESIDHLCINPIHRIGFIHKWYIDLCLLKRSVQVYVLLNNCKQNIMTMSLLVGTTVMVRKIQLKMYIQCQWKVTSILISTFLERYNTALLLRSCFWSTTDWFGDIKPFEPWNYGACAFCFSHFFRIWNHFQKTTCKYMPWCFHWKCYRNGLNYPIKHKKWGSNFKIAPKLHFSIQCNGNYWGPSRKGYNAQLLD